jgi:hypothetical protein
LLAGSVLRNEYGNKYQKVLLFPAEPRKNQKSLRGPEQRAGRPATRCCGTPEKQLSAANRLRVPACRVVTRAPLNR